MITVADLSPDQAEVYEEALAWVRQYGDAFNEDPFLLCLGGYAGTGKTTVLSVLALEIQSEVRIAFCAMTGKAAGVMRKKLEAVGIRFMGRHTCGTVHSLIYRAFEDEETKEIRYSRKDAVDVDLIILDEASMIPGHVYQDLKSYGHRVLAVGDHGQLPPVMSNFSLMEAPYLRLEKIHRQAEDNPIIRLSAQIRESKVDVKQAIKANIDGNHIREVGVAKFSAEIARMMEEGNLFDKAILAYTNRQRKSANKLARKARFGKDVPDTPVKGDQIICLKNTKTEAASGPRIFNGMRATVEMDPKVEEHHVKARILFPEEDIRIYASMSKYQFGQESTFTKVEEYEFFDGYKPFSMAAAGLQFDYGYGLTVHKCIDPETIVETEDGLREARDLDLEGVIATPTGRADYHGIVRYGDRPMLEIETIDGYSLRMTEDHGIDVYDAKEDRYVRQEAKDLTVGSLLRLRLGAEFPEGGYLELPVAPTGFDVRTKTWQVPTTLTEDVAEFLGLMVGDGTLWSRGFRLAKRHVEVADRFDELCRSLFGVIPKRFFTLNAHHVEVSSTFLVSWLEAVGGMTANAKDVPPCILQAPLALQAKFLRGLFEDGTVNLKGSNLDHIEWSSAYEPLRRKVRVMLLRFGIITGMTPRRLESVYVYGQNAKRYGQLIGFITPMKNDRLARPTGRETKYTVPTTAGQYRPASLRRPRAYYRALSRAFVEELGSNASAELTDRLKFHHTEIRSIRTYVGPSMCVEVPDGHQFLQNGFCGWNSQGSQFADVLLAYERPRNVSEKDFRRWVYTAITRSSDKITVCWRDEPDPRHVSFRLY